MSATFALTVDGVRFEVGVEADLVMYREALLRHPEKAVVCGCARCKRICMIHVSDCACCGMYGSRKAGGERTFYPKDGLGHRALMPRAEFLERIARRVA